MTGAINTLEASVSYYVLGETLRPLLTNAMGSAVEIFDTRGPAGGGPPSHRHPWEEVYLVMSGELEVTVDGGAPHILKTGGIMHVPANTVHSYRNVTEAHFLTIVTTGKAAKFFADVSTNVEMNPPDIAGVLRVGATHDIEFVT